MVNAEGEEITETDQFIGSVYELGESLVITIPASNCKYSGIKTGNILKIWYKKTQQKWDNKYGKRNLWWKA